MYDPQFQPDRPQFAWLIEHLDGWQFGEQGLVVAIADHLNLRGRAIEYGAGDGDTLPLTIERYVESRRGGSTLVEIDETSREKLFKRYPSAEVRRGIDWGHVPKESVAIAVIDIDSHDSAVMRDMLAAGVRPAVIVVEHMDREYPVASSHAAPLPRWAMGLQLQGGFTLQDTAETLHYYAHRNGYERIGLNRCNSFFIRGDLYPQMFK